jgi:hypothetical protein
VNHCLLEAEVMEAPQIRYTQDNQTPIAEMTVQVEGLRPDDPPSTLKVVGWGNLAQDLQNRVQAGQRVVLEGRMRINSVARADGVREKKAELTLARLHPLSGGASGERPAPAAASPAAATAAAPARAATPAASRNPQSSRMAAPPEPPVWNTAPLVPGDELAEDDDIPF